MKRIIIFIFLAVVCLSLIILQVKAENIENEYKISFMFQADKSFCIISLKDPLGESEYIEKLEIAPIIINGELFLPIRDFAKMIGGKVCWDAREKRV